MNNPLGDPEGRLLVNDEIYAYINVKWQTDIENRDRNNHSDRFINFTLTVCPSVNRKSDLSHSYYTTSKK